MVWALLGTGQPSSHEYRMWLSSGVPVLVSMSKTDTHVSKALLQVSKKYVPDSVALKMYQWSPAEKPDDESPGEGWKPTDVS